MRRVLICVPGIYTSVDDATEWHRRYAARFEEEDESNNSGVPYAYFASAIAGPATLDPMADGVAEIIKAYENWTIDAVGHSHGCAILLAALSRNPDVKIRTLSLIAAAADVDCEKNGLNEIAQRGQVQLVQILYSRNDTVLASFGGLPGYGQLGLGIVKNPSQELGKIINLYEFSGDHSDYFNLENNERTFDLVTDSALSGGTGSLPAGDGSPLPTQGGGE